MTDARTIEQRVGWIGGLAEWTIDRTAYLSVVFTWKLPEARSRAIWYHALGYDVIAGGPALYDQREGFLDGLATIKRQWPDAIRHQNPDATMATRGCNEDCFFCSVPRIEGAFTYFPDFAVRPILCDNNLSAIEAKYQDYIIERYQGTGVPLLDANSGFEPKSFDGAVFERWRKINRGPWRFGYDQTEERPQVEAVMRMLRAADVPPKKIRPYVLIGCEPVEACLGRIRQVIEWGGEPHVQAYINPRSLERQPQVLRKKGWSAQLLTDMARWANRRIWRYAPFEEYRRSTKTSRPDPERFNVTEGLFA